MQQWRKLVQARIEIKNLYSLPYDADFSIVPLKFRRAGFPAPSGEIHFGPMKQFTTAKNRLRQSICSERKMNDPPARSA